MGWHRTRYLKVEQAELFTYKCSLWTCDGLKGLEVHIDDKVIHIPRDAILELVAQEYIDKQISRLEQMTTEEVIALMYQAMS